MKQVFVDTNIIIDFTKKKNNILKKLFEDQENKRVALYVNPIVIAEFFSDQNVERTKIFVNFQKIFLNFSIIEINSEIGYMAAELLRKRKVEFIADAFVAATCLQNRLTLVTRNVKHFRKAQLTVMSS